MNFSEERVKNLDSKNAQKKLSKLEKQWVGMMKVMAGGEAMLWEERGQPIDCSDNMCWGEA